MDRLKMNNEMERDNHLKFLKGTMSEGPYVIVICAVFLVSTWIVVC